MNFERWPLTSIQRYLCLFATYAILAQGISVADSHTWVQVKSRIEERAKALPALKVKCLDTTFQAAGVGFDKMGNQQKSDGTLIQSTDLSLTTDVDLMLDKTRWRWEIHGPVWEGMFEGVVRRDRVNVYDGQKRWAYDFVDGDPSTERRAGWVAASDSACHWMQMPQFIPWMILYHPLDTGCGPIASDRWRPAGEMEAISSEGNTSLLYQRFETISGPPSTMELFFDPAKDFALSKLVRGRISMEVAYSEHPAHWWFPSNYTTTQLNADRTSVEIQMNTEVVSLDTVSHLDDTTFEVRFPPGIVVRDTSKGSDAEQTYYTLNDGTTRQITQEEWIAGIDYSKLEQTKTGDLAKPLKADPGRTRGSRLLFLILANGIVLLAIVSIIYIRRIRKEK